MRKEVKKFLFLGIKDEQKAFFTNAQNAGIIQFISKTTSTIKEVPTEVQQLNHAIKILRGLPSVEQEETDDYDNADTIVSQILALKNEIEKCNEENRILKLEIARVAIFGSFSTDDIAFIEKEGHRHFQYFTARHGQITLDKLPPEMIFVGTENDLDYFVAINKTAKNYDKMIEMHVDKPVNQLKNERLQVKQKLQSLNDKLKNLAKYNLFLHHALVTKLNKNNLTSAQLQTSAALDGALFTVEGWVPEDKIDALNSLAAKHGVVASEVAVKPKETIPTYLENNGLSRVGEDLVHVYDTPSHTDRDPSLWVLFAFAFFFSFIVGDGGYGLVFLATALYLRYSIKKMSALGSRLWKLLLVLSLFCIGWGLLINTFFGVSLSPSNPLMKTSMIHWLAVKKAAYHIKQKDATYQEWVKEYPELKGIKDPTAFVDTSVRNKAGDLNTEVLSKFSDNIMMELALTIGIIHIILSLLRYSDRNLPAIGWIVFIIGGYLYFPHYLGADTMLYYLFGVDKDAAAHQGIYLLFGGIALAVLLSILVNKLYGVLEAMNVIQIFGDIMSYLRLYALALAGGMVAATVNDIAGQIGLIFGAILTLLGHSVNIALSIMGGVIHGLRLNYLEWYHYSFEGGGKLFSPLKLLKIEK